MKVDQNIVKQCGVCDGMVFQSKDNVVIKKRYYHGSCAELVYWEVRKKRKTEKVEKGGK